HLRLFVIQGDQKLLAAGGQNGRQVRRVALTHQRRQGDQGGASVYALAGADIIGTERKNIAAANLQRARTIDLERPDLRYLGLELLLGEKRLDRLLTQLHAQHPEALTGEPGQVQTLATQWHQHRRTLLELLQPRPVAAQPGVDLVEMKTDVVAGPTALPEVCVHAGCSIAVMTAA